MPLTVGSKLLSRDPASALNLSPSTLSDKLSSQAGQLSVLSWCRLTNLARRRLSLARGRGRTSRGRGLHDGTGEGKARSEKVLNTESPGP